MGALEKVNNNSTESSGRETKRTPSSILKWITDEVAALGLALGEEPSTQRLLVYAEDLCDIPQEILAKAFQKARKQYEYPKLPPVAFIRRMAGAGAEIDGRPGPEEAWARMPKGERVEDGTVVWCEEERAAYDACRSLLLNGDQIGARMAFKERYERELAEARAEARPVRWSISAGYDMEQRLSALATAVRDKRISLDGALGFIPGERISDFAQMLPPAQAKGLLAGHVEVLPELPGLQGVLARMRMEGTVPEELKPTRRNKPSPLSEDELRKRREELRAQARLIECSRNDTPGRS